MKRVSSKEENKARRKAHNAAQKPGEVNIGDTSRPYRFGLSNVNPRGYVRANFIGQKHEPGDLGMAFGRESKNPMFIGGEGGNGWAVRSTLV